MNGFKEFFMETFDFDLFLEVSTLAQTLKQHQDPELVKLVKEQVRGRLVSIPFFSQPMGKKMLDRYVNFFSYQVLQDQSWSEYLQKALADQQNPRFTLSPTEIKQNAVKRVAGAVGNMWRDVGDYFAAMGDRLASKINNPGYSLRMAEQESEEWHEEMAARERGMPDQEAKPFLTLDHLGKEWKGWKWVDLERGYCSQEAEAMGHCGNSGAAQGDNIVSLRDPEGYAHLTFIINNGHLGESKGRANNKPSKKYHKAIVELLKSDHIHVVRGGGYAPENNFHLDDLHDDHHKELKDKPYLDDPIGYALDTNKGNENDMVGAVNEAFNSYDFESFDGSNFGLGTFETWGEIEEASKWWHKEVDNITWLDDPWQYMDGQQHGYSTSDLLEKLNKKNQDDLLKYFKEDYPKEFEEMELEELVDMDDEIENALSNAASDTHEHAVESEAYKSMQSQLGDADENGFYIDFKTHPWKLILPLDRVRELYKEMQRDETLDDGELSEYIKLTYSAPYNGYDGYGHFDDDNFNDMVADNIGHLVPDFAGQTFR
jgi:hypothetical protein